MNDDSLIKLGALGVIAYTVYIGGSVASGRAPADGIVFGTLLAFVGSLGGVLYERKRSTQRAPRCPPPVEARPPYGGE